MGDPAGRRGEAEQQIPKTPAVLRGCVGLGKDHSRVARDGGDDGGRVEATLTSRSTRLA